MVIKSNGNGTSAVKNWLLILSSVIMVSTSVYSFAITFNMEPIKKQVEETKKCTETLAVQFNELDKKVLENSLNGKFIKESLMRIEKLLDGEK